MSLIVKPNTFSAGAVIYAAEHNDNFDTIYNEVNGNLDNSNIKANAAIVDTKLAQITTAQKVHGSSLTGLASINTATAGIIPVANINVGTGATQIVGTDSNGYVYNVDGRNIRNLNASALSSGTVPFSVINMGKSFYTATTTFVPATGVQYIYVTGCGGGGGGGGDGADDSGAGGGSSAYCIKSLLSVTAGNTYNVTIGAGGVGGAVGNTTGGAGGATSITWDGGTFTINGGRGAGIGYLQAGSGGVASASVGSDGTDSSHGGPGIGPTEFAGFIGGKGTSGGGGGGGAPCVFGVAGSGGISGSATGSVPKYGFGGGGGGAGYGGAGGNGAPGFLMVEW